jgi:hypothetical protein
VTNTTNHYDLIVLGNDIAGLVSAALVARRGKRVLVLPHGTPDGSYRLHARTFALDLAPVVHAATPPIERVLHELGLQQQLRRMHAPVAGLVQHVLDDARLDLEPGERNLERELERTWPDEPTLEAWTLRQRWAAATDEVLDELLASDGALSADGFWGRRFLSRVASQLPARDTDELAPLPPEHGLRRIADAPLPWIQHLTPAQLGKAASLRLGRLWSLGPDDLPSGERRVREILLQRIELHSGEVKRELRVAEILVKRGKVVGVSLLGKRDRYGCDHLIVATDPRLLLDKTMLVDAAPRSLVASLGAIAPAAYRYVVHLEVDERGVTPALSGLALVAPSGPALDEGDPDFVPDRAHGVGHTYLRAEPAPQEGVRRIAITRIVGVEEPLADLRELVLDELDTRGVLPFCHDWVRLVHSPHDGREATDGRGDVVDEIAAGSAMTVPMSPLYFVEGEPLLGVGLLPSTSGVRGLSFASRLNLPGLGLEGEFAAGTAAAALVASPARSPLSRSSLLSKA